MSRRIVTVTGKEGFFAYGAPPLASVNSGAPVVDALEHASNLIRTIEDLAANIGESGELRGAEIFAVQYLAEAARALVDASALGCRAREKGGRHGQDS